MLNPREGIMVRNLRLALPTAAAAFALMTVPPLLPAPMTAGVSGSALAAKSLNASRSNVYRTKQAGKPKQPTGAAQATTVNGSKSNTSERIGRGNSGGARPSAGAAQATTITGSRSNSSDRIGGGNSGGARPSAGAAQATTTIQSSKSNASERMRNPGIGSSR
jgi:hypothetical protein